MPLKTILINTAAEIGLNLYNADDKSFLITKINEAAFDLYTSDDLIGCLREQVFTIAVDDQMISLPWYVYKLRGVRWSRLKLPIRLDDLRPRYATMGYNEMLWRGMTWRIKDERSAICRDISNSAPATISIPTAETVDFTVNITGKTADSERLTEAVYFAPGDTNKTIVNTFSSIKSIVKDKTTVNDIIVIDVNNLELARIPNSELSSTYTIVQIIDFDQSNLTNEGCACIEILYKQKFTEFSEDYDTFPAGDQWDQCIFYKTLEIFHGKNGDIDKAALAKMKCDTLIGNISRETESPEDIRLDFGRNRFLAAQNKGLTNIPYRRLYSWENRNF